MTNPHPSRSLMGFVCLLILTCLSLQAQSSGPITWFCPAEYNNPAKLGASLDYPNLFNTQYDSQWSTARSYIQVLKIYPGMLSLSTDAELSALFSYLQSKNIALAIEWGMLSRDPVTYVGYGVEGYAGPTQAASTAARIYNLGGELAYIAMDEPLYYGHYYTGTNSAQADVETLAENVAANIAAFRAYFPRVIVGDIEPVDAMPEDWYETTAAWLAAYEDAVGEPLGFFHLDILWGAVWQVRTPYIAALLEDESIPMGVIFNAAGGNITDAQWMERAKVNIQRYNGSLCPDPDHVVIQNWMTVPAYILPETSPTAYSYLVNYYYGSYATAAAPKSFFRLYNPVLHRHFYTMNEVEKNNCLAGNWVSEGSAGTVYPGTSSASGLIPLYRLYKSSINNHFYTTNTTERDNAINAGYISEGVAGYVFANASSGGTPLYRANGGNAYGHFYTTSLSEYENLSTAWIKEGISCYLP